MMLAELGVRRPVLVSMVTLIIAVLGLVALLRLRIDLLPDIELPTLTVRTNYDGASPEVIEQRVTQVIEEIVSTVPGIEDLTSKSTEGASEVRLRFAWGSDLDTAAVDVRAILEDELGELPEEIERPQLRKFDVSSFPIVILGVSSAIDPIELTTLLERHILQRLSRAPGVAQVDPWGEYKREIRVELDPARLRALELPLDGILDAIREANLDLPTGRIEQGSQTLSLRAPTRFVGVEQIRRTVIAVRGGVPIRLEQIAEVSDTHQRLERLARINGKPGFRLAIRKQAQANTVEVAKAVLDECERINGDFPQLRIAPVVNQGNFIERSIANVARSVVYGGALAVLVLLIFLRDLRSTSIIALAIPISLAATFAITYFAGLTLNLMTLGGLALGVGMMVDSSIVVLENIYRRRDELGEPIARAALAGTTEVSGAIIASTITTLVIFLPLGFLDGVTGVLFGELALVIVFALGASLLVSLSVIPMLAALLLRGAASPARRDQAPSRRSGFSRFLIASLRARFLTIAVALAGLVASVALLPSIGSEFMPPSDEGEVRVRAEMAVGTRLELVDGQIRQLEQLIYPEVPETRSSVVSVGASYRNPGVRATGEVRLTLSPSTQRLRSNTEIAAELRKTLAEKLPGVVIRTRAPQGQFLLQRVLGSEDGLSVEVRGYALDELAETAEALLPIISQVQGVSDVELTRKAGQPQLEFVLHREKTAQLGLNAGDISRTLKVAAAGVQAGEFHSAGDAYRILVRLADADELSMAQLLDMTLRTPSGATVALGNLVDVRTSVGPTVIERRDQRRLVTINVNVAGRDMGSVAQDIAERLRHARLPEGVDARVAGQFEQQQSAFRELVFALGLALALVYMVLAGQYESFRDPFIVMFSVPVAAIGVLVTLAATNTTLNVQSYIGCIMLGGIVVNNAILLVDQAGQLRRSGRDAHDAVVEAARRRLRPILMTTLTTILALLPLALGLGEGADAQAPLARAVLGGLSASTLLTLVVVPAVYCTFHRRRPVG